MTALASPRYTYSDDPSGRELRRALLVPAHRPGRSNPASFLLLIASALILLAGLLAVATTG